LKFSNLEFGGSKFNLSQTRKSHTIALSLPQLEAAYRIILTFVYVFIYKHLYFRDVLSTRSVSDDRKAGQLNKPPSDLSFSSAGIRVDLPDMQTSVTLPLLSTSDESR